MKSFRLISLLTITASAGLMGGCGGGGGGSTYGSFPGTAYFPAQTWSGTAGSTTNYQIALQNFPDVAPLFQTVPGNFVSPDFCAAKGTYVFIGYDASTGANNVYALTSSQAAPIQLTQTKYNHHNPRFSPDGTTVVFSEDLPTGSQIFSVPFASGIANETQLTQLGTQNQFPSVSPDNKTVVFVSSNQPANASNPNFQIYTVPITGGTATRITYDGKNYGSPSFGNDADHFLCSVGKPFTSQNTLPSSGQAIAIVSKSSGTVSSYVTQPSTGSDGTPPYGTGSAPAFFDSHPRYISNYSVVVFDRVALNAGTYTLNMDGVTYSISNATPSPVQIYSIKPAVANASPTAFSVGGSVFNEAIASDPGNEPQ